MRPSPIPPPIWMLIVGTVMWALHRSFPVLTFVPGHWDRLGWIVMAVAPIAPAAALIQFGRAHTTPKPHVPEAATTLVTSGIYAWSRNPMYLGLAVLLLGWAIGLRTLSALPGPVVFGLLMRHLQIGPEEYALRGLFPAEYAEYSRHVNRWFGRRSRHWREPKTAEESRTT
jgi:protein-S-isoprenylcysteine O-methyltransferase Ste14